MIFLHGLVMMHSKFINYLLSLLMLVLLAYMVTLWIPNALATFIYIAHKPPVIFKS